MHPPTQHTEQPEDDAAEPISFEDWETKPRYSFETKLLASKAAGPNARLRVRPRLTEARWSGNIDIATRVADKLVDNAVQHGRAFHDGSVVLRLVVLHSEHLVIEVDDAREEFPNFAAATSEDHPTGRGLWWVRHYRAQLTYRPKTDEDGVTVGKTVRAVVPLSWAEVGQ